MVAGPGVGVAWPSKQLLVRMPPRLQCLAAQAAATADPRPLESGVQPGRWSRSSGSGSKPEPRRIPLACRARSNPLLLWAQAGERIDGPLVPGTDRRDRAGSALAWLARWRWDPRPPPARGGAG